jgi:hypothetical protein
MAGKNEPSKAQIKQLGKAARDGDEETVNALVDEIKADQAES